MSNVPFKCSKCGSGSFNVPSTKPTIEHFYKAKCANCGASMSEAEIKKQAQAIAAAAIKNALKR